MRIGVSSPERQITTWRIEDRSGIHETRPLPCSEHTLWRRGLTLAAVAVLLLQGCATFSPPPEGPRDYLDRMETQEGDGVAVSAVVLSDQDSRKLFGPRMARRQVQPVWIEIENQRDEELLVMHVKVDPDYFSPSEAALRSRKPGERRPEDRLAFFEELQLPLLIPPQQRAEGYIFTNRDPGLKAFTVQLVGDRESHDFIFAQLVPGLRTDLKETRADEIYADQTIPDLDRAALRRYLETLPGSALGGDQKSPGDPTNIVFVGDTPLVLATFARRGWDLTETLHWGSVLRTVASSLFKSAYRTSPVSPLYYFGRRQDFALQKTRGNVDHRNHLRLWRAPVTVDGTPVWVGQISRDIGVKLTTRTLVTHRIDSHVDEARDYLMQDLISSRAVQAVGFASGVGISSREAPRYNYTGDPYVTDGLRLVVFLTHNATGLDEIVWLNWEWPTE